MSAPERIQYRSITRDELVGAGRIITGENDRAMLTDEPTTPPVLAHEPTIAEAANLYQQIIGLGAVARLDVLHDALVNAHRRGRAAEHAAVEQIADRTRLAFAEAIRDRALEVEHAAGQPWWAQQ